MYDHKFKLWTFTQEKKKKDRKQFLKTQTKMTVPASVNP